MGRRNRQKPRGKSEAESDSQVGSRPRRVLNTRQITLPNVIAQSRETVVVERCSHSASGAVSAMLLIVCCAWSGLGDLTGLKVVNGEGAYLGDVRDVTIAQSSGALTEIEPHRTS
jgi:hypothetical protein